MKFDDVYSKYKEIEKSFNLDFDVLKDFRKNIAYFGNGDVEYQFRDTIANRYNGFFKKNRDGSLRKITEQTFKKNFIECLRFRERYGF